MTDFGAYDPEMERILSLSDEDIERIFAGFSPRDAGHDDVAAALRDVETCFTGPAEGSRRAHHLALMTREASHLYGGANEPSDVRTSSTGREILERIRRVAIRGAAVTAAASLSMFGLAFAEVELGQEAETTEEQVAAEEVTTQEEETGTEVEAGSKSVSADVLEVVRNATERGCEFGQEVSSVASQNAQGETGPKQDPCTHGDEGAQSSDATGQERAAAARAAADEKSGGDAEDDDAAATDDGATDDEEADDDTTEEEDEEEDDASENSGGASDEGTSRKP